MRNLTLEEALNTDAIIFKVDDIVRKNFAYL